MNEIALQLNLPPKTFQALQAKASERKMAVEKFILEIALDYLDREAKLATGRAMLRALPRPAKPRTAPSDLAAKHDDYLMKTP
ncbi:MAG: hypothetical protein AAB571_11190 [Chloroflexota bacterium]